MLRYFVAALCLLFLFGSGAVLAEDCSPHCDYWHNYGPYDFTYIEPGLWGWPVCNRQGNCSPHLVYTYQGQRHRRITIHPKGPATRPQSARDANRVTRLGNGGDGEPLFLDNFLDSNTSATIRNERTRTGLAPPSRGTTGEAGRPPHQKTLRAFPPVS